jgi:REP element-mobilizing transposase RayT
VEVTVRTVQERLLLRPDPRLNDLVLGVLGRAQRLYDMPIVAFAFLSNHCHLLLYPQSAHQLARFMGYLLSNVAREVGALRGWRHQFWARRYSAIPVSSEEAAEVGRLRYLLGQGVKEGLVASSVDWPGPHAAKALATGESIQGTWYDRTALFWARQWGLDVTEADFATVEPVRLSPLGCWTRHSTERQHALLLELLAEIGVEGRHQRNGRPPLGRAAILSQRPWDRPLDCKSSRACDFHTASRAARRELRDAYRRFVRAFRRAAELLRSGAPAVRFPPGSFPPALPFAPALEPSG